MFKSAQKGSELAELAIVAERMAAGDYTTPIPVGSGSSEVSRVLKALAGVQADVRMMIEESTKMGHEHDLGDIDAVIDVSKFDGGLRQMGEAVNHLVSSHIAVKKQALGLVKKFGEGDFSTPLPQFPGKKVFVNDTLEGVRASLKALAEDVTMLARAAVEGRLDARADASKHQGEFRSIVQGMNDTLDAVIGPLNEVARVLAALERGDLSQSVTTAYRGQLEELRLAANNSIATLGRTVSQVIAATDQLSSASAQISGASQSMSRAATDQASSVEETSASIEQMAASINQNSDNAKVTDGIASTAATEAIEGGTAVQETVEAMKTIASKINIIDDIAFQTNMLALNATIEAARAGEHGKGFAVVATEVGKLAERSQVAAREIGELASASVETAERAGTLLGQIVPSIRRTSDLVQEIAAASSEQSSGAGQISKAMAQMSKITDQNASSSEQLAATAEEMASQTETLQELMQFFNIGGGGGHRMVSRPAPATASRRLRPQLTDSEAAVEFDVASFEKF